MVRRPRFASDGSNVVGGAPLDALLRAAAEFVGTFSLVFIAVGVLASGALSGDTALLPVALATGLAAAIMVSAIGHISGGHLNPAVTVAYVITRRIPLFTGVLYVIAQLGAAVTAVLMIRWLYPGTSAESTGFGAPAIDPALSTGEALVIESLLTFFLVWVYFASAADLRGTFKVIAGLAIGLTYTVGALVADPLTDAIMNPARAFGSQVVDTSWDDFWIWYAGPLLGGAIAALLYELLYLRPLRPPPLIPPEA